jgi:hypothetical protein
MAHSSDALIAVSTAARSAQPVQRQKQALTGAMHAASERRGFLPWHLTPAMSPTTCMATAEKSLAAAQATYVTLSYHDRPISLRIGGGKGFAQQMISYVMGAPQLSSYAPLLQGDWLTPRSTEQPGEW